MGKVRNRRRMKQRQKGIKCSTIKTQIHWMLFKIRNQNGVVKNMLVNIRRVQVVVSLKGWEIRQGLLYFILSILLLLIINLFIYYFIKGKYNIKRKARQNSKQLVLRFSAVDFYLRKSGEIEPGKNTGPRFFTHPEYQD